jgi:hypothetical protein
VQLSKIFQHAAWLCACLPWLVVIAWGGLAAHVCLGLGHWPTPMVEQYATTLYQWHEGLVIVLLAALVLTLPMAPFVLLRRSTWEASSRRTKALVYLLGTWSVIALGIGLERTSLWAWWMD